MKVDQLSAEIEKQLKAYHADVTEVMNETTKKVAKKTVKKLKETSPKGKQARTKTKRGKKRRPYHETWKSSEEYNPMGNSAVVYNDQNYRLTHLLENGHVVIAPDGVAHDRTAPKPHIKPAEEAAIEEYLKETVKGIENVSK